MHIIEAISRTYALAGGLPRTPDAPRDLAALRRRTAFLGRIMAAGVSRAVAGVRAAHRRRKAVRELSALSDLALKDIGVARGEIPAVVAALDRAPVARGRHPAAGARRPQVVSGAPRAAANDNAPGRAACARRSCAQSRVD